MNGIKHYAFLVSGCFCSTQCKIFRCMYLYMVHSHGCIVFHQVNKPHITYPVSGWFIPGLGVTGTAPDIGMCVFQCTEPHIAGT